MMDLRQLGYFVKIVELGSITAAAMQLRIAQPALGMSVRKLEDELDVQLLVRHSRGVELTDAGLKLYEGAIEILSNVEDLKTTMRGSSGPLSGKVAIGLTPSIAHAIAARFVERWQAELPGVTPVLIEGVSSTLIQFIGDDKLDLCLAYEAKELGAGICESLALEDLFLVSRPDRDTGLEISFADAIARPLLMPGPGHGLCELIEDTASKRGLKLKVTCEIESIPIIRELVLRGTASTILPYDAVRREADQGALSVRRIIDPAVTRTLHLVYSARRPLSKLERAMRSILCDLVDEEISTDNSVWRAVPNPGLNHPMNRVDRPKLVGNR